MGVSEGSSYAVAKGYAVPARRAVDLNTLFIRTTQEDAYVR